MILILLLFFLGMSEQTGNTFTQEQKELLNKAAELYNSNRFDQLLGDIFTSDAIIADMYNQFHYSGGNEILEAANKLKAKGYVSVEFVERDFGLPVAIFNFKDSAEQHVYTYQVRVTFTSTTNGLRIQKAERVVVLDG